MGAPILRLDGVAAPTHGKDSPFFTVELIHGGFFHGSGDNRSYLSGAKACYDFCDSTSVCIRMFDDLIEDIGNETAGRIRLYWLLPGCQLNEDGARLLSNDEETESIVRVVRNWHKFLMFYVDHQDSYNGGGGKEWDDVIANPIAHLPPIFSPKKENIHTVVIEHQSPKRKEGKAWLKEKEMQKYQDKRKSRRKQGLPTRRE